MEQLILTFLKCSLPMTVSTKTIKKMVHCVCLRDMMGITYSINADTGTNHKHYFIDTWYILQCLKAGVVTQKKCLIGRKSLG